MLPSSFPLLSMAEAADLERRRFGSDPDAAWAAMNSAGAALGRAVVRDAAEIGGLRPAPRILVLAGKGNNAGDALLAAHEIGSVLPGARIEVRFAFGERSLRPLAFRAWQALAGKAQAVPAPSGLYDVVLDGLFGLSYRPPFPAPAALAVAEAAACRTRMRVAVDLPSGLDDPGAFVADVTYPTGTVKTPVLGLPNAGRIRPLDLGFLPDGAPGSLRGLAPSLLDGLRGWRDPHSDKRSFGHLGLLGGSRSYPGALLLSVLAALRSGAGLVSAFVPEPLVPAYAAAAPEAMWIGWPEAPDGGLALEGLHLLRQRLPRLTALAIGPGLSREPETLALAAEIASTTPVPLVLDADALQPAIVRSGNAPRILTPHAGEWARLADPDTPLAANARSLGATVVLKGPLTRICDGRDPDGPVYHTFAGGPVLARGGSGDLLAGIIGARLAASPSDPLHAACEGALWHGLAADALARARGSTAVRGTDLLDHLGEALRC